MLLNYLKISIRYLLKNGSFSAINIFGLTLGFLSFLMISLYLHDELNFDSFHTDSEHIYRVIQHEKLEDGTTRKVAQVAAPLAAAALSEFPEVADALRLSVYGRITMGNDPAGRDNQRMMRADQNFFSVFNIPLREGDPLTVLQQPYAVVISEKLATKYFGTGPALGKQLWTELKLNDQPIHFIVTGVMKTFPKNSHLHLEMIIPDATFRALYDKEDMEDEQTDWSNNQFITYIKVRPDADVKALERKLTSLVKNNYPVEKEFKSTFSLQPLRDIHLHSDNIQQRTEIITNVNKPFYIYLFGIVAFLILLIACLNYLNLLTAAAYQRTREIGTRKCLGAHRRQLITQFLGEGIILSVLSLILALSILQAVLPAVNQFIDKDLSVWRLPLAWQSGLLAITLLAGMGASLYPAFVIVKVSPSAALKKEIRLGRNSVPVRKVLVASQFAISILMIASTIVIYRQLNYMEEKDLGFRLENLLVLDINSGLLRDLDKVKSEFRSIPEVQSIAASSRVPGEWKTFATASVRNAGESPTTEMIYVGIDKDFLSTYNMTLTAGRNFTSDVSDSLKVILTKKAVEQLGLTDPVGQIIEIPEHRYGARISWLEKPLRVEVIGVAENFHFESFKHEMMPLVFAWHDTKVADAQYYTLRVETDNWDETIKKLGAVNRKLDPNEPMEYNFLEDRFGDFYRSDQKRGQIFLAFSIEIVLIACLGLFALVSYAVESRTKEIGIRKVLGATVSDILIIIAREFVAVILIATLIALPLAWYLTDNWLNDFAYRVSLGPGVFLMAAVLSIFIAAVTIGFRTIGTALANPVRWLKNE